MVNYAIFCEFETTGKLIIRDQSSLPSIIKTFQDLHVWVLYDSGTYGTLSVSSTKALSFKELHTTVCPFKYFFKQKLKTSPWYTTDILCLKHDTNMAYDEYSTLSIKPFSLVNKHQQ